MDNDIISTRLRIMESMAAALIAGTPAQDFEYLDPGKVASSALAFADALIDAASAQAALPDKLRKVEEEAQEELGRLAELERHVADRGSRYMLDYWNQSAQGIEPGGARRNFHRLLPEPCVEYLRKERLADLTSEELRAWLVQAPDSMSVLILDILRRAGVIA